VGSVLIVDDEIEVGEALAIYLTSEGFRTQIASNGEEALSTMEEFIPDLVICDVVMPVMDGPALMRAMKADPRLAAVPVLLMSGAPSFLREAAGSPQIGLEKPFELDALLDVIEQMTRR
jgi:DNA-binding response OmpR family regulator